MDFHLVEATKRFDRFKELAEKKELSDKENDEYCKVGREITSYMLKWWWQDNSYSDIADIITSSV